MRLLSALFLICLTAAQAEAREGARALHLFVLQNGVRVALLVDDSAPELVVVTRIDRPGGAEGHGSPIELVESSSSEGVDGLLARQAARIPTTTGRIAVAVVGAFDAAAARRRVTELWGSIPSIEVRAAPSSPPERSPRAGFSVAYEDVDAPAVRMSWTVPVEAGLVPGRIAVLAATLGPGGRLARALESERALASSVTVELVAEPGVATLRIEAVAAGEALLEDIELVINETIAGLAGFERADAREIEDAVGAAYAEPASVEAEALSMLHYWQVASDPTYAMRHRAQLAQVTGQALAQAARTEFQPGAAVVVHVYPSAWRNEN